MTSSTAVTVDCRRPPPPAAASPAAHDDEKGTVLVDTAPATTAVDAVEDEQQQQQQQKEPTLAESAHQELAEMLERTMTNNTTTTTNNNSLDLQQSQHVVREKFPPACRALLQTLAGNRKCLDCASTRDPPEWAAISYGALVCIHCSGRHRALGVAVSQVRSVSMDHWTYREIVCMLEGGNTQLEGFFHRHALTKSEFEKQQQKKKTNTKVLHKASSLPITKTMVDTTKTNPATTNTESALEVIRRTLSRENLLTIKTPIIASSLTSSSSSSTSASSTASSSTTSTLTADNITILRYKTKAALFYKNQLEAHVNTLLVDPIQTPYTGRNTTQNTDTNTTKPRARRRSGTTTSKATTTQSTVTAVSGSKTDHNPEEINSIPTPVISSVSLPSSVVSSQSPSPSPSPPTTRDSTPIRNNISATTTKDGY